MIVCEKVFIDRADDGDVQLVQYDDQLDDKAKADCIQHLEDCGHTVDCEPHPVVGPGDDPAISWGDLSDLIEPRDD